MKTIIVTGSAGNLGKAVVQKFIQEGNRVIGTVTYKNGDQNNFPPGQFEEVMVDVSDEQSSREFIETTVSRYGTIDAVVLTVGGFVQGSLSQTATSQVVQQYKINFETAYNIAQPVSLKMMQQNSGRIFFTGSRPGMDAKSSKGMIAYGLAKSQLIRLAELMNDEAGEHNVVTSVVVPGIIDTPINRRMMPDADFSTWVLPETIAELIYFYCSDTAAGLREPVIKVYKNS